MKIDVSLYDFCKNVILLMVIYWHQHFCAFAKQFYLNADWKTWNKYRKKTTQDNKFSKFIYRNSCKLPVIQSITNIIVDQLLLTKRLMQSAQMKHPRNYVQTTERPSKSCYLSTNPQEPSTCFAL